MGKNSTKNEEDLPDVASPSGVGLAADYGEMAGAGYENTTTSDFAVPLLSILQSNSPQIERGNAKCIAGAAAGMLHDTVTNAIFDGEKGVIFVPIITQHVFVEYTPRDKGGGFRGVHEMTSEVVTEAVKGATEFGDYHTKDGNELTETFYVYGYTLATPDATSPLGVYVIPFSSSKIKKYKRFMQLLRTFRVEVRPGEYKNPPLFANRLLLRTVAEKNPKGSYFNFDVTPLIEGDVGKSLIPPKIGDGPNPLLVSAHNFLSEVLSGKRKAAQDVTGAGAPSSGAGGGDQIFQ